MTALLVFLVIPLVGLCLSLGLLKWERISGWLNRVVDGTNILELCSERVASQKVSDPYIPAVSQVFTRQRKYRTWSRRSKLRKSTWGKRKSWLRK